MECWCLYAISELFVMTIYSGDWPKEAFWNSSGNVPCCNLVSKPAFCIPYFQPMWAHLLVLSAKLYFTYLLRLRYTTNISSFLSTRLITLSKKPPTLVRLIWFVLDKSVLSLLSYCPQVLEIDFWIICSSKFSDIPI